MINPLHKPDDTFTIDCSLHFHTAILFSCLLHSCMHLACVFEGFVYVWAGRTHFIQKLTESTNGDFQVRPRKKVRFWITALQPATHWTKAKKIFVSSSKKWMRNNCCDALTYKRKNWQRFWKHLHFNNAYFPRALSQLVFRIT